MDRKQFKKELDELLYHQKQPLTKEEKTKIIEDSIQKLSEEDPTHMVGFTDVIIVMEELSELTKELSKALRYSIGKTPAPYDITGIIEELADVSLCLEYIKIIFDITDREVECAESVKASETKEKMHL